MKKHFTSTLLFTAYLFASTGIALLVGTGGGLLLFLIVGERGGNLITVITKLCFIALPCIILYIAMHRIGYKSNYTYEEKSVNVKASLITIIISIFIFTMVDIAMEFPLSNSFNSIILYVFTDVNEMNLGELLMDHLLENYYPLLILSTFLQSIIQSFFMIFGFYMGYKKREKDRQETMADERMSLT